MGSVWAKVILMIICLFFKRVSDYVARNFICLTCYFLHAKIPKRQQHSYATLKHVKIKEQQLLLFVKKQSVYVFFNTTGYGLYV